ncbi:calcium-binding protein [Streptomyces sp. NPDC005538]|uniref:calcium-binding protein n=1 Tax=unclassified Streptomyces TaxID=2593676 RepID=UPI0033A45573
MPARSARSTSALTVALALGTGLAVPLLLAGTAGAATAPATAALSTGGGEVLYKAAAGQTNKVTVTASRVSGSDKVTYVIDDVVTIKAGTGCAYPTASDHTKVSCTVTTVDSQDPYATAKFTLGDKNDVVSYNNKTNQTYYFASIDLGPGNDRLEDTGRVDGNYVSGGTGNDSIDIGKAAVAWGGDGNDGIVATGGLTITQGGNGNDALFTDGDSSSSDGGDGNDTVRGGDGDQILSGGDGNDVIEGYAGNDFLYGGKGNDKLYGGAGADTLYGNSGNDILWGGAGKDFLSGGPGRNVVHQN